MKHDEWWKQVSWSVIIIGSLNQKTFIIPKYEFAIIGETIGIDSDAFKLNYGKRPDIKN